MLTWLSFLFSFFLVLVSSIIILIVILRKHFNYWKIRNVAHEEPSILFGSYKDFYLGKGSKFETVTRYYSSLPDQRLIGLFHTRWPELLIRDPDLIKSVLIKDFSHFIDRQSTYSYKHEALINNLFHMRSDNWKALRPKMSPIFTSGKLKNMFPLIIDRAKQFNECISEKLKDNNCLEVRDLMSRYTMDVIGSCAFGIDISSMKDSDTPFIEMGKLSFQLGYKKFLKDFLFVLFPELCQKIKLRLFSKKLEDFMRKFVNNVISDRNNEPSNRNDFIDLMLEMRNREKDTLNRSVKFDGKDIEITDDIIMSNVFVMFAAGFETSSTATSFVLFELALHPEIQERLYNSIVKILDESNGQVTYENISKMDYLDMVLSESLRKYPPLNSLSRVCSGPYTFPNTDVTIDKNCSITIPIYSLHHDPKYYPEPKIFDPERFSTESKKNRHSCVYLPFGDGPRNCIGARFAKIQSMVGIIAVIRYFKVEVCEKTERELTFDNTAFITTPKNGLWLRFVKR